MSNELSANLIFLADELARDVSQRYQIDSAKARAAILEMWQKDQGLQRASQKEPLPEKFKRTRVYKDAASQAKKKIYYDLRRYKLDDAEFEQVAAALRSLAKDAGIQRVMEVIEPVLQGHVSTAERLAHADDFFEALFGAIGDAESILDVGSGVLPLLFPFDERGQQVSPYCAADRDRRAVEVLEAYAQWRGDGRLATFHWDIADGWAPLLNACRCEAFDVALMLKLVPVVQRQQPELLSILAGAPARKIIVTGSRDSMVKRKKIEQRELAVIQGFARHHGFEVIDKFDTPDEVGYLLAREKL